MKDDPKTAATVLIVDDDSTNIQVAASHLRGQGLAITYALSAEEALARIENHRPDIILLDIMMPVVDGISLCRQLKERREYRDIPVIFLTARVDKETLMQAYDAGASDYITKPFFGPELMKRVQIHLEYRRLLGETEQINAELNLQVLKAMKAEEESQAYQRDIVAANLKLKELASHDSLTGLLNRRRAWELLEYEIQRSTRYNRVITFLLLDIDNFKSINDSHGHETGDEVLKRISVLLKQGVRKQDIVARWGGEEFLIALPETGIDQGLHVAETMRKSCETLAWNFKGRVTVSIGVSQYPSSTDTPERQEQGFGVSISLADKALYFSKEHGRNRVTQYDEHLDKR
ncbi:GGDEF domain-containing response regulator [Spirochaeta lutea]|uniref:diguanylate cyclase n=1 Tax=Spirochaeta lutea TaxID=1480694 RepID=A0A098R0A9_9SPIO|nr:diguanylate cyclase [Spirochaeta lutea]KGE73605.1 hypothetical protein DC28_02870 [Spirochaeta lutea]